MSPNDSSSLIDSPAASRLGQHRAYFQHEDVGRMRSFALWIPSEEWLQFLRNRFQTVSLKQVPEPLVSSPFRLRCPFSFAWPETLQFPDDRILALFTHYTVLMSLN